jgi:hypothetical protein
VHVPADLEYDGLPGRDAAGGDDLDRAGQVEGVVDQLDLGAGEQRVDLVGVAC